ncbi:MAG TPA: S-layer homology domain-containing protein [Patescibacteria group bacterium]|nr:S-layer homology domain-containing protein [Patescibacteria group bacterium]
MKKKMIAVLAILLIASLVGPASAAPNPFVDVPAKHWAYDAVNTLVKNKVIDGYGDGTFRGDRIMSRYEMAQIVAKAVARADKADAANKALIDKLQVEFAAELQNLGVRVEKLEKNMGSVQFSGDARIRYMKNLDLSGTNAAGSTSPGRFENRIRLTATADLNEEWSFSGRFGAQNTSNMDDGSGNRISSNGMTGFDRMELKYAPAKNKNWAFTLGRSDVFVGQGMIYDNFFDGFTATYTTDKFRARAWLGENANTINMWLDESSVAEVNSQNLSMVELFWQASPKVQLTTAYMKNISSQYPFKIFTIGGNAQLSDDFKLSAEWAKNYYNFSEIQNAAYDATAQKTAWWVDLAYKGADPEKPGTWGMDIAYKSQGKDSIDTVQTTWNYSSGISGSTLGGYGLKGWEFNFNYTFAKGANLNLGVGVFKPYDTNYSLATGGFDKYNTAYHAITTFAF